MEILFCPLKSLAMKDGSRQAEKNLIYWLVKAIEYAFNRITNIILRSQKPLLSLRILMFYNYTIKKE